MNFRETLKICAKSFYLWASKGQTLLVVIMSKGLVIQYYEIHCPKSLGYVIIRGLRITVKEISWKYFIESNRPLTDNPYSTIPRVTNDNSLYLSALVSGTLVHCFACLYISNYCFFCNNLINVSRQHSFRTFIL